MNSFLKIATIPAALLAVLSMSPAHEGKRAFEPAFANGHLVTISVKDPFPGTVARAAQGDYFEVIYPLGWSALTQSVPQCNPCDHGGDGDDMHDYHDHVFGGEPSQPGAGAYKPIWRLSLVVPAYIVYPKTEQDLQHNAAVSAAYAKWLPIKSADAVRQLLAAKLGNGVPIAELLETDYVFQAAFVSANAVH
jgi:hypothetical protein